MKKLLKTVFLVMALLGVGLGVSALPLVEELGALRVKDDGTGTLRFYDPSGQEVTGKNLAVNQAEVGSPGERRVASVASVELNSGDAVDLYTVPAGYRFYPTKVLVRDADGTILPAFRGNFGVNVSVDDLASIVRMDEASQGKFKIVTVAPGAPVVSAGQVVRFKTTAAHGASRKVTFDLFGILIPA